MSRETDSSPSGPQGRGGAAYPSGTPPYGSRQYQAPDLQQDASENTAGSARQDEPRTETTLTTRVRINIPGSRPIPPVVVRTPVADGDGTDGRGVPTAAAAERPAGVPEDGEPDRAAQAAAEPAEEPAQPGKKPASDWFAPRKKSSAPGAPAGGAPASETPETEDDGARQDPSPYQGSPYQEPAFGDGPQQHQGGPGTGTTAGGQGTPPFGVPPVPGPGEQPNGPTAGPATGSAPLAGQGFAATGAPAGGPGGAGPGRTPPYGTPEVSGEQSGPGHEPSGPARLSDDTAILTPQQLAPEPAQDGSHVSGDTLTSGVPVVAPETRAPFPGGPQSSPRVPRPDLTPRLDRTGPGQGGGQGGGPQGPAERPVPQAPAPAAPAPAASRPAKKKGRSKMVLLVGALIVIGGGLYGAGLVVSHSDVPKGTTVLGVDIGGSTKDQAVDKLESTLGKRADMPLKLSVSGKAKELSPENAGLALDDQATVEAASGPDYNPVDVVGSLFGRLRVVDPVLPVDDEKLTAALTDMAGSLGTAREGTISFASGKPVAQPGKAGIALDVAHAKQSVQDAYRNQVQTGATATVTLPTVQQQPTIDRAEIDRAMKEFADPAMSDVVTIESKNGQQIRFGQLSLPKILSMKAVDGKLVDEYDLKALKSAYGSAFAGVLINRANGTRTEVGPQDVADQLRIALRGRTTAERTRELGSTTG